MKDGMRFTKGSKGFEFGVEGKVATIAVTIVAIIWIIAQRL